MAPPPFGRTHRIGTSYEVCWSPDGEQVVTLGRNVVVWEGHRARRVTSAHPLSHPSHVDWSPDGTRLLVKDTSGNTVLLDRELEVLGAVEATSGEGVGLWFDATGATFVDASWEGDVWVRSTASGEAVVHERWSGGVRGSASDADRRHVAIGTSHPGSVECEVHVRSLPWSTTERVVVTAVGTHLTGLALGRRHLAVGGVDSVQVLSTDTGSEVARRDIPGGALAWSPDDEVLVLADHPTVRAFTPQLEELWSLELPYACAAAFSPDGGRLALGSWQQGMVATLKR